METAPAVLALTHEQCILNLCVPESLHRQVRELAQRDKVSINQFVTLAVAEKVAALRTLAYIEQRGQQGSREQFDRVLQKIAEANLEPVEEDRLLEGAAVERG